MNVSQLAARLRAQLALMRCPQCGAAFSLPAQSMVCQNGHCFDLSRRGYVNLAPAHSQAADKYGAQLFESRARLFQDGFYAPVVDAVCGMLAARFGDAPFTLADAGCGEGYYARAIAQRFPNATVIGLDLNRDAVTQAARTPSRVSWFVADVKRLPLGGGTLDALLYVITPADYSEFARGLKPDGAFIKVIPGADYLCEVRAAVAAYLRNGDGYSNASVREHLLAHAQIVSEADVHVTYPLSPEQSQAFARMTPMTFSVPGEALAKLSLCQITIHMQALCCRFS